MSEESASTDSIFVSIASYRDSECIKTIEDLFIKSRYPQRITVGICQQNAPEDPDCLSSPSLAPYLNQIKIIRLSHYEAKGPMYARALIEQNLFNDEMFYLQIDSHMLFVPHWDIKMIEQLALCPSENPILTTYPHDFDRLGRKHLVLPNGQRKSLNSMPPTFIRFREFHKKLHFSEQEKNIFADFPDRPYPSLLWAAGFSFTLGKLIHQVPYDEFCDYVFVGEEMLMAIRYYTHGWDFFSPSINLVYHLLKRTYRKVFWEQVYRKNCVVDDETRLARKALEVQGVRRIHKIISAGSSSPLSVADGSPTEIKNLDELYGLGPVRTLQDWMDFTGINYFQQTAEPRSYLGLSPQADEVEKKYKSCPTKISPPSQSHMMMGRKMVTTKTNPGIGSLKISPMGNKTPVVINKQNRLFQLM